MTVNHSLQHRPRLHRNSTLDHPHHIADAEIATIMIRMVDDRDDHIPGLIIFTMIIVKTNY